MESRAELFIILRETEQVEKKNKKRKLDFFEVMKRSGKNKTETKAVKRRPFLRSVSDLSEIAVRLKNGVSSALVSRRVNNRRFLIKVPPPFLF